MAPSSRAWTAFDLHDSFTWKRWVGMLLVSIVPAAVCFAFDQGVLGLLIGATCQLAFPLRLSVTHAGLVRRWLFLTDVIPAAEITAVCRIADPRPFALRRRPVLTIETASGRRRLIFGAEKTLDRLADELRALHLGVTSR